MAFLRFQPIRALASQGLRKCEFERDAHEMPSGRGDLTWLNEFLANGSLLCFVDGPRAEKFQMTEKRTPPPPSKRKQVTAPSASSESTVRPTSHRTADSHEVVRRASEVLAGQYGGFAALATVISRSGSAPQIAGAKMLLLADGTAFGTVGGGAIEAAVLDACRQTLRDGQAKKVSHDLVRDLAMCCGGSMEVFVEYLEAKQRVVVVGAGHVAQALAPCLKALGYRVEITDDREDFLQHPAFHECTTYSYDADELADGLQDLNARDIVIIVTRDHARDEKALADLLERPLLFLGMIGSRRKVVMILRRILRRYRERNRPLPNLAHVHAPIGLALGGRTPAEIAISVAAQLIATRHGGSGQSMNIVEQIERGLAQAEEEDDHVPN